MPKDIKFIASGSCSALGNFADGDIARNVPDDLASHLVNEAFCAKFMTPVAKPNEAPQKRQSAKRSQKEA